MKKRIFYLDFLRAFAILMVLLLHSINPYITNKELFGSTSWNIMIIINAFVRTGVPIFFMISGYLLLSSDKSRDFKAFYKKSLLHIIIPLVFWNIVYFGYKCIMGYIDFDITILLSDFINCGTEYHLWYLYTLVGIYLLVPFLKILVDNLNTKQSIWLLLLMMFCTSIRPFINTVTPLYIYLFEPLFNGYIGCFFMGYILGNIKINNRKVIAFSIAGLLFLIISVFVNYTNSSSDGINMIFNYGYSLCHYVMAAVIFVLSRFLFESRGVFVKATETVSKLSFGVYLVHVLIIDIILKYFMIDASPVVSSAYIFLVGFGVSLMLSFILNKIKYIKNTVS